MSFVAQLSDGRERRFAKRDDAVLWIRRQLTEAAEGTGELVGGPEVARYEVSDTGVARRVGGPGRPVLPDGERRVRVDVRLRPAVLKALDGLAARSGKSRTETLEALIKRAARKR